MAHVDLRKLKDEAAEAVDRGKYKKALQCYEQLEQLDATDGNWSRRAAEMWRKQGDQEQALAAYLRAVETYVRSGFLIQAVATCKLGLQLHPSHPVVMARLATLQQGATAAPGPVPAARPRDDVSAAPAGGAPPAPLDLGLDLPPDEGDFVIERMAVAGQAIDQVDLARAVPGAHAMAVGGREGVIELDLDDVEIETPATAPSAVSEPIVDGGDAASASNAPTVEPAVAALRAVPLFGALDPASLTRLALGAGLRECAPGEVLLREGQPGDTMFVIVEGQVAVVSEGPPRVELARLGPGEFFGEVALVTEVARSANVVATAPTQLLAMSRQLIHELVSAEPAMWPVLLRFLRTRLLDRLLATSPLFQQFDRGERDELMRKFRFLEVAAGTPLVAQGAETAGLFLLMAGQAAVARDQASVAMLGPGDLFGEMSLLANDVAGAAVTAHTKCLLLLLPVADFRVLTMTHPQVVSFLSDLADRRAQGASDVGHVELL